MPASFRISKIFSSFAVSFPSTQTVPSLGISNAFKCFAKVDLPEPLCPSTAINCPSSTSILTSSSASVTSCTSPCSSRRTNLCFNFSALINAMCKNPLYRINTIFCVHIQEYFFSLKNLSFFIRSNSPVTILLNIIIKFGQMSHQLHLRKIVLAQCLVQHNRHRIGQVQGTDFT